MIICISEKMLFLKGLTKSATEWIYAKKSSRKSRLSPFGVLVPAVVPKRDALSHGMGAHT